MYIMIKESPRPLIYMGNPTQKPKVGNYVVISRIGVSTPELYEMRIAEVIATIDKVNANLPDPEYAAIQVVNTEVVAQDYCARQKDLQQHRDMEKLLSLAAEKFTQTELVKALALSPTPKDENGGADLTFYRAWKEYHDKYEG